MKGRKYRNITQRHTIFSLMCPFLKCIITPLYLHKNRGCGVNARKSLSFPGIKVILNALLLDIIHNNEISINLM